LLVPAFLLYNREHLFAGVWVSPKFLEVLASPFAEIPLLIGLFGALAL
jgi:hypothetical protein